MPIDALVLAIIVATGAIAHFVWWDTAQRKKPTGGCTRQQATRNTPKAN